MDEGVSCPVPPEQRPLEEFLQLTESWFFSWPAGDVPRLKRSLLISWLLMLPVCTLVASGSWTLKADPPRLVVAGAVAALVLPLLLLMRQWLGWPYVMKRLLAENVEYEESGWYDGQIWEKPLVLKEKESLIASIEVKPILKNIIQVFSIISVLALFGILLFQYNDF